MGKLYHFTDINGFNGMMESKAFWLANSMTVGDPQDRIDLRDMIPELKGQRNKNEYPYLSCLATCQQAKNASMYPMYIMCFSQQETPGLWNTCAQQSSGLALIVDSDRLMAGIDQAFKPEESDFKPEHDFFQLENMNYCDDPKAELDTIAQHLVESLGEDHLDAAYRCLQSIIDGQVKSKKWADQKEVRLFFRDLTSPIMICEDEMTRQPNIFLNLMNNLRASHYKKGVDQLITRYDRIDLKLDGFFDSNLIPEVVIGKNFKGSPRAIREKLDQSGLKATKISFQK